MVSVILHGPCKHVISFKTVSSFVKGGQPVLGEVKLYFERGERDFGRFWKWINIWKHFNFHFVSQIEDKNLLNLKFNLDMCV